jgi:hypothetical protein
MTKHQLPIKRQTAMTNQETKGKLQGKRVARRFRRLSVCRLISHCRLQFAV